MHRGRRHGGEVDGCGRVEDDGGGFRENHVIYNNVKEYFALLALMFHLRRKGSFVWACQRPNQQYYIVFK